MNHIFFLLGKMDPASGEGEGKGWGGRRRRRGLFFILASSFPPHLRAAAARRADPGCGGESSGPASRPGPAPAPSPRRRRAPAAGLLFPSRLAASRSTAEDPQPDPAEPPAARRIRGRVRLSPHPGGGLAAQLGVSYEARAVRRAGQKSCVAGTALFWPSARGPDAIRAPRVAPNAGSWVGGAVGRR